MNNAVKKALGCYKSEKVALSIRNLYVNVTRFTKEFDSRFFGVDLDSDQWIQGVIGVINKVCIAITDYLDDIYTGYHVPCYKVYVKETGCDKYNVHYYRMCIVD